MTFANETASGWQIQNLATPLTITANTTYVVSVNTGNTYYVASTSGLASKVTNFDLSTVVGSNGVFATAGSFPNGSWQNSNYFRDVAFVPGSAPTYTISGSVSGAGSATMTLTSSGNTVATVTTGASGSTYTFNNIPNGSYTIVPSLSGYTFSPATASVTVNNANVTGTNFTAATATTETIFTTQTPADTGLSDGPGYNYELGMLFQSDVAGQITAIRFYKDSHETGTHTGHIWSVSGTLLATATFANETASGWQSQTLTTPLATSAFTTYVVSVNTGNTYYVVTSAGLASKVSNLDLYTVVGNNGVFATAGSFPNGSWQNSNYFRDVTFVKASGTNPTYGIAGTTDAPGATVTVTSSGSTVATTTADNSGNYTVSNLSNGTYTVTPSLNAYSFSPTSASVTISNANVSGVNFTASTVTTETLFTSQTPASTGLSDGAGFNYELGTLIQADTAGQITAIRFYKDSHESGTHTGHIWSASGTLLATATFANETASGWQSQTLTTPLAITANTTYVVSVNTGNTYYVATSNGLASKVTNLDLSSVVGNDGVYAATPGSFPNGSWMSTNYFRDVTFLPGTAPTYSVSGTITGAGNATVTLSANGNTVATISAGASGTTYTFSSVNNGTYTVVPSLSGYTFTPPSASITVNGGNVTGVNFAAAQTTSETLFTTQAPTATGLSDGASANYELGTLIQSGIAGQITAIRFYKDSA